MSWREARLKQLNRWADEECFCTPEQETGDDPTECRTCEARGILNRHAEYLDDMLRHFCTEEGA